MRNNLIFYGVPQEERETPERLLSKVRFHKCIIFSILYVPCSILDKRSAQSSPQSGQGCWAPVSQPAIHRPRGARVQTRPGHF